jgi:eukaryotic-like serine/threonine-protein kinase
MSLDSGFARLQPFDRAQEDKLESWKQIAVFFNREVRTVQRWEEAEAMPVRRHRHRKLGSVYAYQSELRAWWEGRSKQPEPGSTTPQVTPSESATREIGRRVGIVLLPFVQHSQFAAIGVDVDGLAEEIASTLGQLNPRLLGVVSRCHTRLFAALRNDNCPRSFADRALYLLEGSLRPMADGIRVYIQVVSVADMCSVWTKAGDFTTESVQLEAEIAAWVARCLPVDLLVSLSPLFDPQPTHRAGAKEACEHGYRLSEQRTSGSIRLAVQGFERALEIDPSYTLAYSGLTRSYSLMSFYSVEPAKTIVTRARGAALGALAMRPAQAEAHASLGDVHFAFDWDWRGAEAQYLTALALNPTYEHARAWYAGMLWAVGRFSDAHAQLACALELAPESLSLNFNLAELLYYSGNYAEACRQSTKLIQMDSSFALGYAFLGLACEQMHNYGDAVDAFRTATELETGDPCFQAMLAHAYGVSGNSEMAKASVCEALRESEHSLSPDYDMAATMVALNEPKMALAYLECAYDVRNMKMANICCDPRFEVLRGTTALRDLTHRMNFQGTSRAAAAAAVR